MIVRSASDEFIPRTHDLREERSVVAIFAICMLLFVDVQLPVIGSSNRLVAVLTLPLLLFGRRRISTPFCATAAILLPVYYLVPPLVHPDVDAHNFETVFVYEMAALGAMVVLARVLSTEDQRRQLTDMLITLALVSATVAILQRYGGLEALGRDRWGRAVTASHDLRGAGFLADPNFLATVLASILPVAANWRFSRLRLPAIAILALGVNATNSRAGILLAVLALALTMASRLSSHRAPALTKGRKSVIVVALCLIVLFAANVGGQRDRAIEGMLIGVGVHEVKHNSADPSAELSALSRRDALRSWVDLGFKGLPFGYGLGALDKVVTPFESRQVGAHNAFAHAFGEGGVAGLLIDLTVLLSLAYFFRRLSDPFAIMGVIVVAGGLFLNYPGSVFMVLPMGLADGIRAARLGRTQREELSSPASHSRTAA